MSNDLDDRRVEPKNGFGIAALCLAIPGLVFGLIPLTGFIALICGALAVIFGLLGHGRARRKVATNKGMAITSTILGVGAIGLGILGMSIVFNTVDELDKELKKTGEEISSQLEESCEQLKKSAPDIDC